MFWPILVFVKRSKGLLKKQITSELITARYDHLNGLRSAPFVESWRITDKRRKILPRNNTIAYNSPKYDCMSRHWVGLYHLNPVLALSGAFVPFKKEELHMFHWMFRIRLHCPSASRQIAAQAAGMRLEARLPRGYGCRTFTKRKRNWMKKFSN